MSTGRAVQAAKPSSGRKSSVNTKSSVASSSSSPATTMKHSVNKFSAGNASCCQGCGIIVAEDTRALQCDRCMGADTWKCASCLGLTDDLYDQLLADSGPKLRWFCDECDKIVLDNNPARGGDRLDKLMGLMERVLERYQHLEAELNKKFDIIEEKLKDKCDTSRIAQLESRLLEAEKMAARWEQELRSEVTTSTIKMEACVSNLEHRMTTAEATVQSRCAASSIIKAGDHFDDEDEREEKEKRKTSVIIHGVRESDCELPADRQDEDLTVLAAMLHELDCDEVKATQAIRLGKRSPDAENEAKPRPINMVVESEDQKIKVIRSAKNLRLVEDGAWKKVFIHQDLTLKEREERRNLLAQLKRRRDEGETGLALVGNKIVKRFIRSESQGGTLTQPKY